MICELNIEIEMNSGILLCDATLVDGGISSTPCPIIIEIDGGDAFTTTYPPVNGLILGGTA